MTSHFDLPIIFWLRHAFGGSWMFDYSAYCLSDSNLFKGGLFMAALWWFWFRRSGNPERDRVVVISTLFACMTAIAISKGLENILPMRHRPYLEGVPGCYFPFNLGMDKSNSFPSDHATLFFGLVGGFWFLSRRTAIVAGVYAAFFICLPRVFLGLHYPSDLLGGACVGIGTVCMINGTRIRTMFGKPVLALSEKYPGLFYAGFFLFSWQTAVLFDDLRSLASALMVIKDHF